MPASPSPVRRMRVPSSTPAGTLSESVRSRGTAPVTAAGPAHARLRAGARPRSRAGLAGHGGRHLDRGGLTVEGFLERNLEIVSQVRAALAAGSVAAAPAPH